MFPVIPSDVKIACGDLFQDNCEINYEKVLYLYVPSITECSPNDPFNDWTLDNCTVVIHVYEDFIDGIVGDFSDLYFYDQTGEYSGNVLIDS